MSHDLLDINGETFVTLVVLFLTRIMKNLGGLPNLSYTIVYLYKIAFITNDNNNNSLILLSKIIFHVRETGIR